MFASSTDRELTYSSSPNRGARTESAVARPRQHSKVSTPGPGSYNAAVKGSWVKQERISADWKA